MDQSLQQVSISSTTKVFQFLSSPMLFIVLSIRYSVTLSVITAFIPDIRIQQNRFYIIHDTTYTLYLNQPIKINNAQMPTSTNVAPNSDRRAKQYR
jgi:hypothetical protein